MDFFSYKFFAEFPIRVDRLHNIAMRYAFCYYNPKGFRWSKKGVEKISKTFSKVQPLTTLASSLHASVCGKEKTWWW